MKITTTVSYFQKKNSKKIHKFTKSQICVDGKIAKEKFYAAKKPIKICDVNVDNIVISKLAKTKINTKYLVEYLDKAMRSLVLIMLKMSGYVKTFKFKKGNDKLMSFRVDDEKLLEKY